MTTRQRNLVWASACFLMAMLLGPGLGAQEASNPLQIWLSTALGGGVMAGNGSGVALGVTLIGAKSGYMVALHASEIAEIDSGSGVAGGGGIVVGKIATNKYGYAFVGAGVGLSNCDGFGGPECEFQNRFGIPVVAEAALRLTTFFGLGLQTFANLNTAASYWGLAVSLQLGRVGGA